MNVNLKTLLLDTFVYTNDLNVKERLVQRIIIWSFFIIKWNLVFIALYKWFELILILT